MSSVIIAITLCNHALTLLPEFQPDELKWRRSLFTQVLEWADQLQLPKLLVKYTLDHFKDIVLQVNHWIRYHFREIFQELLEPSSKSVLRLCIRRISWHSNGAINYRDTAKNLVKSDELKNEEKYRLACTYCLKDEIENRWKTLAGSSLLEVRSFINQPLISYWNCFCAHRLYAVPTERGLSKEEYMIRRTYVKNWPAVEYFFDLMDAEKQVSSALFFIDMGNVDVQNLILTKLNETQRLSVYICRGAQIIRNYLSQGGVDMNEPNAISTWYKIRDLITEDQFEFLMKILCQAEITNSILTEIWTSADRKLKRHILNLDNYDFIGEVLGWACKKHQSGLDFLFAVLEAGAKLAAKPPTKWTVDRKIFFQELCEQLTLNYELDAVTRLLDLCVPHTEDSAQIRRILERRTFRCDDYEILIDENEFLKLEKYLNFFYPPDIPESKEITSDLLLENFKRLIKKDDFLRLEKFLTIFYPETVPESRQIASNLLLENFKRLIFEDEFLKLKEFLNIFYPENVPESRKIASDLLLENCRRLIVEDDFTKLETFLNLFYPADVPESRLIVRDLLVDNLEYVDLIFCVLYMGGNFRNLNDPLATLESSYRKIILQHKKFLLVSKSVAAVHYKGFRLSARALNEIFAQCLPHEKMVTRLVRIIIFSDEGILKLHHLILDKNFPLVNVKRKITPFINSYRNKRKLRNKLISSLTPEELRADPKAKKNYLQALSACGL